MTVKFTPEIKLSIPVAPNVDTPLFMPNMLDKANEAAKQFRAAQIKSAARARRHAPNKLKPETLPEIPAEIEGNERLPFLVDEKMAAKILGVSVSYLRKNRAEGAPRLRTPGPAHVHVCGCIYYHVDTLRAWIESLKRQEVV